MGKNKNKRNNRRRRVAAERQQARIRRKRGNRPAIAYEEWKRLDRGCHRFTCKSCNMRFENALLHLRHCNDGRIPDCSTVAPEEVSTRGRRNAIYDLKQDAKWLHRRERCWRCRYCNKIYYRQANYARCEEFHAGRLGGNVDCGSSAGSGRSGSADQDEDGDEDEDDYSGEGTEGSVEEGEEEEGTGAEEEEEQGFAAFPRSFSAASLSVHIRKT